MSPRLKALSVENFRSIRGQIQVPLDAPVVLIHGPNGAGKTSLLSAIEAGLVGAAPTLERVDPNYVAYLPHKDAPEGRACVSLTVSNNGVDQRADLSITEQAITGHGLLQADVGRFFTERCYLGQSTLGRLLEIYQHQDAKKTDSALTRFVKEILGLGPLDALIEGLHSAGDVRRLRTPAPHYWSAREDLPGLEKKIASALVDEVTLKSEQARFKAQVDVLLAETGDVRPVGGDVALMDALAPAIERDEAELLSLARIRRDLSSAASQLQAATAAQPGEVDLIQVEARARRDLELWQAGPGDELRKALEALATDFPSLPSIASDIEAARAAAQRAVAAELARLDQIIGQDALATKRLGELHEALGQGRARLDKIDTEMAGSADDNQALASALSQVVPHVHDENCPVCARDFGEVSQTTLAAHLSLRIRELVETAGRLQSLARDKAATQTAMSTSEAERQQLLARRVPIETMDAHKLRRGSLAEHLLRLQGLAETVVVGAALQASLASASRALTEGQSRQSAVSGFHDLIAAYAQQLGDTESSDQSQDLQARLQALLAIVGERESSLSARQDKRRKAQILTRDALPLAGRMATLVTESQMLEVTINKIQRQKAESDRRIELAKGLAAEARTARTALVRRVFNEELNAVWRELFIRLAPDEPFVPAFALPKDAAGAVEAILETHYRSGGLGGNPRTMLSAGNLNTAALTLFLALHLSVRPTLPWLVIDDPVQSMDEVHIAQFAALLRTLSKQQGRQVIIAVHERSLFEYLALELSPAFLDDRLITIELGRAPDGMTTASWDLRTYAPDRAIAA